jgi:alkylation response protein AidB-like acyl-CoA dehydrogenase
VDFNFSEEQQLLSDTVQRFVREHYTFEKRREILKSKEGWSREVWRGLADLGLTALNVPASHDGMGGGPVETMLVMNALGNGLVLEPFLAASVVTPALLAGLNDKQAMDELMPLIGSGERIVIVAHQEQKSRGDVRVVETRARKSGAGYVLDGYKAVISHGGAADELLVSARTSGDAASAAGVSVFRVDPKASGVRVRSYKTIDGQTAADIELKGVNAQLVGEEGKAAAAIAQAHDLTLSALCAEAVGIMEAMLKATVEYVKNRKQFGQPIGKFQALQHRLADMLCQSEQAKSMSYLAAIRCTSTDAREREIAMSAAKIVIGQAGRFVGQQSIQLHGGMGMTDELMISHHFKRLTAIDLTGGDTDFHLQKFVAATAA